MDALLAQLCRRHDLVMLSTDRAVELIARHADAGLWARDRGEAEPAEAGLQAGQPHPPDRSCRASAG